MKSNRFAALFGLPLLCGFLLGAAAEPPEAAVPIPEAAASIPAEWEQPPVLEAEALLGPTAIAGEHYKIEPKVESDGLMNRYVVSSNYQRIGADGDSLALERAHEQDAIAALRAIKTTEAYKRGLVAAANAPLAVTRQALTDPMGVMKAVPGAVTNLWSDVSSAIGSVTKGAANDGGVTDKVRDLLGYHKVKARLASEMGVDVYSSNDVVQTDLDDVSWTIFAGGVSIDLAMSQAPLSASLSRTAVEAIDGARAPLWKIPPATLAQATSKALQTLGLAAEEADAIAWHPVCTLTHQTTLVAILVELKGVGGREAFARLAGSATDEAACRFYVETAQLLWSYHRELRPVATLHTTDGVVTLEDAAGWIALPLRADYVFWTPRAQELVDALPAAGESSLWLSGVLSDRTRSELDLQAIELHERVSGRYPVEIDVAAVLVPERAETAPPEPARD